MTKAQAAKLLTAKYEAECERFPRTRDIPLSLYLRRNVPTLVRWRNSAEYAAIQIAQS